MTNQRPAIIIIVIDDDISEAYNRVPAYEFTVRKLTMIQRIRLWFLRRRKTKAAARYEAGFNHAAGWLLMGKDINELRGAIYCVTDFDDADEFEDGAIDAIEQFAALIQEITPNGH